MTFKILINQMVLNDTWTSLGKYMIPKEVEYTNHLKEWVGGNCSYNTFNCTIKLRPKYQDDLGILKHEQTHAKQYGRLFWIHAVLGLVSKNYRLLIELEAYREQVKAYSYKSKEEYGWIVKALCDKYNLGMEETTIREYVDYTFMDLIKEIK